MRVVAGAGTAAVLAACATTTQAPEPAPVPPPEAVVAEPVAPVRPAPTPLLESAPVVREDAPLEYVVKKGDTLWGIANRFMLDPWQWPEVWYVNDQVRNPHKIYPGDRLKLVYVNGRPRLGTDTRVSGVGVERLSPQVREEPLDGAIPIIPIDAIRNFLRGPRLVTSDELNASPYLLAFDDDHLVGGQGVNIYVENLEPEQAYTYSVVRRGEMYRDPDNGDTLGYEAIPVGDAEVLEYGKPSTALLSRSLREALVGDRLLPAEPEAFSENFYPRAPAGAIDGRIIAVTDALSQIGQYQIVTLNRGTDHGLEPGHVLDILQSNRIAQDPYSIRRVKLPDSFVGQLIVFKVTPRVSFGLVMAITEPVHKMDKVEKPVAGRR
ncbi:LysM domain-containing protein [Panacagrimonas perspica]|uniref:LysM domain-containing protein n=1 Tax=Panacagrimonas perspica TaxID=381431 RepID=A0A4R7P3A8_9GAMM|nr:LysM domain-containing protein [Panacagrimonas perspica]TDU28127.1 LysM domain-containing protein [Panacagrimonas perspica]